MAGTKRGTSRSFGTRTGGSLGTLGASGGTSFGTKSLAEAPTYGTLPASDVTLGTITETDPATTTTATTAQVQETAPPGTAVEEAATEATGAAEEAGTSTDVTGTEPAGGDTGTTATDSTTVEAETSTSAGASTTAGGLSAGKGADPGRVVGRAGRPNSTASSSTTTGTLPAASAAAFGTQAAAPSTKGGSGAPEWWSAFASISGTSWVAGDGSQRAFQTRDGGKLSSEEWAGLATASADDVPVPGAPRDLDPPPLTPRRQIRPGPVGAQLPHRARWGMRLGVNRAHIDTSDEFGTSSVESAYRYGVTAAIFDSLGAGAAGEPHLGAKFIRQPGAVSDLFFPTTGGQSYPLPLVENLDDAIAEMRARITKLVHAAQEAHVGVVFTLFTLGGGSSPFYEAMHSVPDPRSEFAQNILLLDWSLHAGEPRPPTVIDVNDSAQAYVWGDTDSGGTNATGTLEWDSWTLDTRDRYKLTYVQNVAYKVARMLLDIREEAWTPTSTSPASFDETLEGIELFNEVNAANIVKLLGNPRNQAEPETSGAYWAAAVAAAVEGFHKAYVVERGVAMPPLWWPSLGSVAQQQEAPEVIEFQRSLITTTRDLLGATAVDVAALINQDTHWYRFLFSQGTALALTLVDLVEHLQAQFEDAGLVSTVSVCELGASMTLDHTRVDYPRWVMGQGDTSPTARAFQAAELVRRFGVACCSGAKRAGWHAHMGASLVNDDYAGTGLRQDAGDGGANPVRASWQAHARPSFWTFQRWQELFGGQRGKVVHPPVPRTGLYQDLQATDAGDVLTVLRFFGTSDRPYAYVIFVDSAYQPPTFPRPASVSVSVSVDEDTRFELVQVVPDTTTEGTSATNGTFPDDSASWAASTATIWAGPADTLTLTVTEPFTPFVWFTNKALHFG